MEPSGPIHRYMEQQNEQRPALGEPDPPVKEPGKPPKPVREPDTPKKPGPEPVPGTPTRQAEKGDEKPITPKGVKGDHGTPQPATNPGPQGIH